MQDDNSDQPVNSTENKNDIEKEKKEKNKKIFIIIGIAVAIAAILITVLLLLMFCSNRNIPDKQLSEITTDAETTSEKAQTESTETIETVAVTTGTSTEIEDTTYITTEETEETVPETEDTAEEAITIEPTISLEIDDGPIYSPADRVCYYRIKATVTGTPTPDISWSRDDSDGAFEDRIAQVNLYSPSETYTLIATATNSVDSADASITLSWGCNRPPAITAINLPEELLTGEEYNISASASDPDGDILTYNWSVSGGSIYNPSINPTEWVTPLSPGYYDITVTVSDGKGGTDTLTENVEVIVQNRSPIVELIQLREHGTEVVIFYAYTGYIYDVSVGASDPDGDTLYYSWEATGINPGTMQNNTSNPALWTAPYSTAYVTIKVTVDDGKGGVVIKSRNIEVKQSLY